MARLNGKQILKIFVIIQTRPLFFFDDDPDGTCAFLQLYKYKGDGKGVIVKAGSKLTEEFARKVDEYSADLVIVLDIPIVDQDFLDRVSTKVLWLDHHPPRERKRVTYYNPRLHDDADNRPTSYWTYQIAKKDIWLAMTGCVADWQLLDDIKKEFIKKYPDLMDKSIKKSDDALFETKVGELAAIIAFSIKGSARDAMKYVKVFTRINDPYELLENKTPQANFVYKRYKKYDDEYQEVLKDAKPGKDELFILTYSESKTAMTKELSNVLLHRYPKKFIIVGRERNDEIKLSLRSTNKKVKPVLDKALVGVEGYGGGHDYACGANIKTKDFDKFIKAVKKELK